ncbi:molecular chaperone HtpG [Buchnera aphidicola]|uniref:Chaperone protein HtpG n=1 Tax=Buchnera aphidicola subsp. Tuberolachnus salignus TaxID=98804 RepID=A0A160SW43_BUCTT|nr:molecular chaperone HtpG [Buchnera aphidicola]CUR53287.1 Chaperone protein HtpG [Buchnera aphidicola (Tuberolachnus salignus)]
MDQKTKKTHVFQSEVKQLLHLMIHSLYSNKEIFLREVISNSSDAIEKLRFSQLSHPDQYKKLINPFKIQISLDKKNHTITVIDNGIGMTKDEIINNLGTIAKSGTKNFLEKLQKNKKEKNDFIGQFGVGFYSTFIVAKKVSVYTRHANLKNKQGLLWESEGKGTYTLEEIPIQEIGTQIILHLKSTEHEFLEEWKIKNIVSKYSDHISIPIEISKYDEKKKIISWDQINKAKAIWTIPKKNITKKEYQEFYTYLTKDIEKPLTWIHNIIEGSQEYISLMYIPQKSTWDMWNRENKHGLKLYVKNVYVMDDATQFLPNYLRFVKGIIDSQDLPLNISREILQDNPLIKNLRKILTKRILMSLTTLQEKEPKKYQKFWNNFGIILKEGIAEDTENKNIISNLLRFSSLHMPQKEQNLSLKNYLKNFVSNQEKIYFLTSESYEASLNSPHLEIFKENKIDVLLLSDRVDEWMMNYLLEFENKKFQSISKTDLSLEKMITPKKNITPENNQQYTSFIEKTKNILKEKVKDVRITHRLTNTPVIVVTDSNDMSTQMAKLFTAAGQTVPAIKYILEINMQHPLIQKIINIKSEKNILIWIEMLFEQAILVEKGNLENPNNFIQKINQLLLN